MKLESSSARRVILILVPWVLLVSTYIAFTVLSDCLGPKLGYFLAFVFYWLVWCYIFPIYVLGFKGFKKIFAKAPLPFGKPSWVGIILLLVPSLLAGSTVFIVKLKHADLLIILVSLGLALVNATGEEVLWRGVYIRSFPDNVFMGYLYPSIGFALWHISPQSVHSTTMPGGMYSFLAGALFLGLCWGWVAWKSKSIRWTVYSHILTNFLGLGATIYF